MQTITEFDRQFGTDEQCRKFVVQMRWPDGVIKCARCGSDRVFAAKTRPFNWVCKSGAQVMDRKSGEITTCDKRNGYRFSVTAGTIFEDTKIALNIWFKIGYLMLTAKKGISAKQIYRVMFGENSTHDYHTTWYICMRWRAAMAGDMYQPLSGVVEVDEAYFGGKDRNRHWDKKSAQQRKAKGELALDKYGYGKVGVIGAIERKGNVVARVIGSQDAPTLASFVRRVTDKGVRLIATDENQATSCLDATASGRQSLRERMGSRRGPYQHHRIVLVAHQTRRDGPVSQRLQEVFTLLPQRVFVPLQQPKERGHVCRPDYDVQPIVEVAI